MPRVRAGDLSINYVEHGSGDNVVLAVHGNLGCADWLGAGAAAAAARSSA